jgi:hypothetical protein
MGARLTRPREDRLVLSVSIRACNMGRSIGRVTRFACSRDQGRVAPLTATEPPPLGLSSR